VPRFRSAPGTQERTEIPVSERIRWEPVEGGMDGYVGTVIPPLFTIHCANLSYADWMLTAELPGDAVPGNDLEELKAETEKWLERFASSLGAIFKESLAADLRSRADDLDGMVSHDAGHERDKLLVAAGLRRAADLAEHGDQPMANPEGADR
jgi:hypothetical protein